MNASVIAELVLGVPTLLGGGAVVVARLTRIAVAAETLADKLEALSEEMRAVTAQVQDHETRLSRRGL